MINGKTLLLLFLFGTATAFSQSNTDGKRDYQWVTGYGLNHFSSNRLFDFNYSPMVSSYFQNSINFSITDASICSPQGDLLFYTNGFFVADKDGNVMPHGDSLGYGLYYQQRVSQNLGLRIPQGALILPWPGSDTRYCLFHQKVEDSLIIVRNFLMSIIEMNANNGLGDIREKNVVVLNDTIGMGGLTAVRHSNNRDWWILIPQINHNTFYRYLLNPEGIWLDGQQDIGFIHLQGDYYSCFSPDGNKFALAAYSSELYSMPCIHPAAVFDFNRTNGYLNNYRDISFYDTNTWIYKIAFSSNSRFLYAPMGFKIYQWDVHQNDVNSTKTIVGYWDGYMWNGLPMCFGWCQLGADGKIYSVSNGPYVHVIDQPDLGGIACNVIQRYITTPGAISAIPNFPNFRLGSNVGIDDEGANPKMDIITIPNPANNQIRFEFNNLNNTKALQFEIVDVLGSIVFQDYFAPYQSILNCNTESLSNGVYFALLKDNRQILGKSKFIIKH